MAPKRRGALVSALLLAGLVCFSGCSTINPASTLPQSNLRGYKSAYVVAHGGNSADMDAHMQEALISRGVSVRAGPESAKPSDVDFYVVYTDSWRWDLMMYLKDLNIQFYEAKTGAMIASGSFSNSFLHSFPNPGKKVSDVIATMYGEKPHD
ncbi:MAG TPA: hypothetical protein VII43_04285 [Opitutaceae bacterium]